MNDIASDSGVLRASSVWRRAGSPGHRPVPKAKLTLTPEALALLIGGVELKSGSLKAWYER